MLTCLQGLSVVPSRNANSKIVYFYLGVGWVCAEIKQNSSEEHFTDSSSRAHLVNASLKSRRKSNKLLMSLADSCGFLSSSIFYISYKVLKYAQLFLDTSIMDNKVEDIL